MSLILVFTIWERVNLDIAKILAFEYGEPVLFHIMDGYEPVSLIQLTLSHTTNFRLFQIERAGR